MQPPAKSESRPTARYSEVAISPSPKETAGEDAASSSSGLLVQPAQERLQQVPQVQQPVLSELPELEGRQVSKQVQQPARELLQGPLL